MPLRPRQSWEEKKLKSEADSDSAWKNHSSDTGFLKQNSREVLRKGVDTPEESPQKPPKRTGIRVLNPDSSKETPPTGYYCRLFSCTESASLQGKCQGLKVLIFRQSYRGPERSKMDAFQNLEKTAGFSRRIQRIVEIPECPRRFFDSTRWGHPSRRAMPQ